MSSNSFCFAVIASSKKKKKKKKKPSAEELKSTIPKCRLLNKIPFQFTWWLLKAYGKNYWQVYWSLPSRVAWKLSLLVFIDSSGTCGPFCRDPRGLFLLDWIVCLLNCLIHDSCGVRYACSYSSFEVSLAASWAEKANSCYSSWMLWLFPSVLCSLLTSKRDIYDV